jgi:hypothetical protein
MNDEAFNLSVRKLLKMVGINSQREIERAVEKAISAGKLTGTESLPAKMTLHIEALDLNVEFKGDIALE